MKALIFFFVFCGFLSTFTQAQDVQLLANKIAKILGYPANRLIVTDESAKYAGKTNGQAIQVISMKSEDGTFASTGIAITKRGALLKPDIEAECKKRLAAGSASVRRFDLNQGIYGYAGLGIAGPGGSEELIIATWPDCDIDFQIKMTIPREGLGVDESTKAYHSLVASDTSELTAKLIEGMSHIANYAATANIRPHDKGNVKVFEQKKAAEIAAKTATENTLSQSAQGRAVAATNDKPFYLVQWLVVTLIIVSGLGLLWVYLKKRK